MKINARSGNFGLRSAGFPTILSGFMRIFRAKSITGIRMGRKSAPWVSASMMSWFMKVDFPAAGSPRTTRHLERWNPICRLSDFSNKDFNKGHPSGFSKILPKAGSCTAAGIIAPLLRMLTRSLLTFTVSVRHWLKISFISPVMMFMMVPCLLDITSMNRALSASNKSRDPKIGEWLKAFRSTHMGWMASEDVASSSWIFRRWEALRLACCITVADTHSVFISGTKTDSSVPGLWEKIALVRWLKTRGSNRYCSWSPSKRMR
mmetsp:Transcript_77960/g.208376  ORF Transcript_77960/g.208376 Transcript_77960/m.208376 type:complete len:262 (-) Transcript_77960:1218-2003(-)